MMQIVFTFNHRENFVQSTRKNMELDNLIIKRKFPPKDVETLSQV